MWLCTIKPFFLIYFVLLLRKIAVLLLYNFRRLLYKRSQSPFVLSSSPSRCVCVCTCVRTVYCVYYIARNSNSTLKLWQEDISTLLFFMWNIKTTQLWLITYHLLQVKKQSFSFVSLFGSSLFSPLVNCVFFYFCFLDSIKTECTNLLLHFKINLSSSLFNDARLNHITYLL